MRKNWTKILAYMLAATMYLSAVNVPVYAQGSMVTEVSAETETMSEAVAEDAIVPDNDAGLTREGELSAEETKNDGNDNNTWDQVTTENIFVGNNYRVTFTLTSNWDTGYNANVKLENTGDSTIQNWYLGFDYNNSITNIWNAEISSNEDVEYVIKNVGWNQDIDSGNYIEFGISGDHSFKGFPENYVLIGTSTEVTEGDYAIQYIVDSDWGTGFHGFISVTNNTNITLEDWVLEFNFDREITEIWNGIIEEHEENHYVVRNAQYNSTIAPGESISIGIKGCDGELGDEPFEFRLYSYKKTGIENVDFELITDNMEFRESDSGNFYFLTTKIDTLSGWANGIQNLEKFTYTIQDEKKMLCSGTINIENNWNVNNIGFGTGYNLLTLTGEYKGQKIEKEYIIINSNIENAGNIGIDFTVDKDADGVPDYFEEKMDLDSMNVDTDGDGLNDYLEIFIPNISPTSADGDQDGVLDIDEDYDGDGLSNYEEECVYNTDLSKNDTDGDGLNDYDEVITCGTNPKLVDTDEDKLNDFWEVEIGSNPLLYEESFSYTKTIEKDATTVTTINVSVTDISAEQVKTFDIGRVGNDEFFNVDIPGYIENGYEFSIEGTFNEAIVEISGEFEITDEFQPALYYFNDETQLLEYVSEQTIDNGKIVASLEHFSKYILLNKIEFDKVWTYTFLYDENAESYSGLDVVFVIDSSESMLENDTDNVRKTVAKKFINRLTDNDVAALISFNYNAITLANFTNDKTALCKAVDELDSSGGTNLAAGIYSALNLFENNGKSENRLQCIIMLTDGVGGYSATYTSKAKNANIIIYTIGLGNDVSQTVLTDIAEGTGGNYYHVNQADELHYIFDTIAEKADYYKDSDGDGVSDYYEKEMAAARLVLGTGVKIPINYLDDDSDDDGLLDGEEIEVQKLENLVYVKMYSNPNVVDTDNDGMNDDVDNLPLVPNTISELLIHQTESGEGLRKKTEFSQNKVAEDLTFNNYSYIEIVGEIGVVGTVAGITPEFMMWAELTDLFLIGCITSDYKMSITLMEMLEEFKRGNTRNIGKVVTINDEFNTEMFNRFSAYTLTERTKNYSEFNTYINQIREIVVDELADNKGNLLVLKCNGPREGLIYDMAYDGIINYPVFSLKKDVALVLAIHDFQGHNITITDYKCDGKTFSGTLRFHFYDHFGLDSDDYEWAPGFCDWFTLQHYDRFNGEHSPYITVVDISIEFSGGIE